MKTFSLFLLSLLLCTISFGQSQEAKVQTVLVLKFIENIKWPHDRKDLVLGIVGKTEVMTELEHRLKVRNPDGIVVKQITASEAATCDIVFVADNSANSIYSINGAVGTKPVLIITESDLSRKGSCISIVQNEGKMHFIVNKLILEARGLKVTSSLLTLSKQV